MSATLQQVHAIEVSQIGVGENPPGSNNNKFTQWYGLTGPWCDMFQSWCFTAAGIPMKYAYCPYHINAFKALNSWHQSHEGIQMGDLVFYDWNHDGVADHIEWVESVSQTGIVTIGGNVSDKVGRWSRSYADVMGYGRPIYAPAPVPAPPAPAPKPPAPVVHPLIQQGSKGAAVVYLQTVLNKWGAGLTVDGDFGPKTDTAVRNLQRFWKLSVDGQVGPNTWKVVDYLNSAK